MHRNAVGHSRKQIVQQVIDKEPSVKQYAEYIPIGWAVEKLRQWKEQGATLIYITSRKGDAIGLVRQVLQRYGFPDGKLESRSEGEEYKDVAERVMPDVLIEDDCESIGGESEMVYPNMRSELKPKIKSVVVKEFEGIDHLANDPHILNSTALEKR